MNLKIKTLKNVVVDVEVDGSASVKVLKEKLAEKLPEMIADRQTLIHAGKILSDDQTVNHYSQIKEGDSLVVMVTKV